MSRQEQENPTVARKSRRPQETGFDATRKEALLQEADKWFKKLNTPSSATYRIAHARHDDWAGQFDCAKALDQYLKTCALRMERLNAAVKIFPELDDTRG